MRPVTTYTVLSAVPEELKRLPELAHNIHWSWDQEAIQLFFRMEPDLWEETNHNPVKMLGLISQSKLAALAADDGFLAHLDRVSQNFDNYMQAHNRTTWYAQEFGESEEKPEIAYFSFEFGLTECIPNYSGGLGVLAGDHLKAASDLDVPLMGVGLLYQTGYFRQYLNVDGWQQEMYPENDFYNMPLTLIKDEDGKPIKISVELPGRDVYAQIWRIDVGRVDLYLLDCNISENSDEDKRLTAQLYGGDREMRVKQEILLGIGGLRALIALGLEPSVCHMNEGHAAFMALERTRILMERRGISFDEAASICAVSNVFTTHTPVPAGNDFFAPELMYQYFGEYWGRLGLERDNFMSLGRFDPNNMEEHFCMTILALRMSTYSNGVSRLHGEVARDMWKNVYYNVPLSEVPIESITNGIHIYTWISKDMSDLFDRYLGPRWREDSPDTSVWERALNIPDEELWRTHERRRERLVAFSRRHMHTKLINRGASLAELERAKEVLDPDALTIGFARRFATYKRATLLFRDEERILRILRNDDHPIQFIFAGKAHPHDAYGKEFIRQIIHFKQRHDLNNRIVFLEDYDMVVARYMVQGVDIWLNTPRRPNEASGTSGMKAVFNGALNLSIIDGWWAEGYRPHVGWAIGRGEEYQDKELQDMIESNAIYDLLEQDIVQTFYDRGADGLPREWIGRLKAALRELGPVFTMDRVVQDYTRRFYHPALLAYRRFAEKDQKPGLDFSKWLTKVKKVWPEVEVGLLVDASNGASSNGSRQVGDQMSVEVSVYLGSLEPSDVSVQLFEGGIDFEGLIRNGQPHEMTLVGDGESKGWYTYSVSYECRETGHHGYTARVIPSHDDLDRPLRLNLVTWAQ
ncbi:MAG: glycosyltransferase family 1 protein [Chloroflexi bacterium]|nr:glycosyltransferase family 1 protein [Chloroflexota bacterium]